MVGHVFGAPGPLKKIGIDLDRRRIGNAVDLLTHRDVALARIFDAEISAFRYGASVEAREDVAVQPVDLCMIFLPLVCRQAQDIAVIISQLRVTQTHRPPLSGSAPRTGQRPAPPRHRYTRTTKIAELHEV